MPKIANINDSDVSLDWNQHRGVDRRQHGYLDDGNDPGCYARIDFGGERRPNVAQAVDCQASDDQAEVVQAENEEQVVEHRAATPRLLLCVRQILIVPAKLETVTCRFDGWNEGSSPLI